MNKIPANSDGESAIDRAAAEWLIRRDRGLTPVEQDEFFQWLAADPRNGEWLARHQQTWKELDALAHWRPEHSNDPNPDLLARPRSRKKWLFPSMLAAAAGVTLAFSIWRFSPGNSSHPAASSDAVVATAYQSRVLDDGTVVELNGGAVIEVLFMPSERRVRLVQGEAHFSIAKNPARPFVVRAAGVDVRAVGTAFNVRLGSREVEVLVTEGHVRVDSPSSANQPTATPSVDGERSSNLHAGQRAIVSLEPQAPPPRVSEISTEEVARLLAWQPKLLDFNSAPLAKVVAEFNRRNHVQLVIADPALGETPIVASFRSDNIDGFVRLLELSVGVTAERSDNTITLRRAR